MFEKNLILLVVLKKNKIYLDYYYQHYRYLYNCNILFSWFKLLDVN